MKLPFDSVVKMGQVHADHLIRDCKTVHGEWQEKTVFKSMSSIVR